MRQLEPGTRIDRFEIVGHLGGGMGVVYKAVDLGLNRRVAIKFYSSPEPSTAEHQPGPLIEPADDDEFLTRSDDDFLTKGKERFRQEAVLLAMMDHPNIVKVFEPGEYKGTPYIVMEFVEGVTLERLIHEARQKRREIALEQKLRWMEALCSAAGHAHERGVVHRDIKPANLILHPAKGLHLVDFGISRELARQVTRKEIAGTSGYMSPEQVRGAEVDCRSDVFAIGTVFYELLCYQSAFKTEWAALEEVPVPLQQLDPGYDDTLVAVVEKALEKKPENRYENGIAVAEAVGAVLARLRNKKTRFIEPGEEALIDPQRRLENIRKHLDRARALFAAGEIAAAAAACKEALRLDPQHPEALALDAEIRATAEPEPVPAPAPVPPRRGEAWFDAALNAVRAASTSIAARAKSTFTAASTSLSQLRTRLGPTISDLLEHIPRALPDRLRRRPGLMSAAAIAVLALFIGFYLWSKRPPDQNVATLPQLGTVRIDAAPWARVTAIKDANGRTIPLPDETSTPFEIQLPPGRYTITLSGPSTAERVREITVQSGSPVSLSADREDGAMTVDDYFDQYLRPYESNETAPQQGTPTLPSPPQ